MPPQNYLDKPRTKDEMACIYAALILADDDVPITAEKIVTLTQAASMEVESIWPSLFARALQGIDIRQMVLASLGSGAEGAGAPSGGATGTGATTDGATEEKKEEEAKKEEPEEDSSDEDMGLGLFD